MALNSAELVQKLRTPCPVQDSNVFPKAAATANDFCVTYVSDPVQSMQLPTEAEVFNEHWKLGWQADWRHLLVFFSCSPWSPSCQHVLVQVTLQEYSVEQICATQIEARTHFSAALEASSPLSEAKMCSAQGLRKLLRSWKVFQCVSPKPSSICDQITFKLHRAIFDVEFRRSCAKTACNMFCPRF